MDIEDNLVAISVVWFFVIILPYLLFGFNSFVQWTTIPDLVDIFFYTPIMGFFLYMLFKKVKEGKEIPFWLEFLAILALFVHFEGHGFHWAANALDVLAERNNITGIVLEVAYFLDEIVSHIVYFGALILYFYVLSAIQYGYNKKEVSNKLKVMASSVFFSFAFTISMIEGQFIYIGMVLSIIYIVAIVLMYVLKDKDVINQVIILYWLIFSVCVFLWSGVYYAIFGSLKQPSEIMG